jgi:CelD/BcsL family acetyltransferase involved in cellulose biosynthesis
MPADTTTDQRSGGVLKVEYVDSFDCVPAAEWRRLAERAGHVFATREWLVTWWRHYGRARPLIGLVRRGGDLVAIVPLYVWWKRGLPVLRFVGHGPGDQLGPICAKLSEPAAAAAVTDAFAALPLRRFLLLAEQVGADQGFGELTGARPLSRQACPVLRFESDSWDDFLQKRGRNFRQQVRRFARRLSDLGAVSYRPATDPALLQGDLDTLFHLHRQRWGSAETPFLLAAAFHREFASHALDHGWLRLWFLEVDGRPVAASYGFRFAGSESFYQAGRDPAFLKQHVGFVLLAHAVRQALVDGMAECCLLRGGEEYKFRFATSDPGLQTFGLARGVAAQSVLVAAAAAGGRSLGLQRRIMDRL